MAQQQILTLKNHLPILLRLNQDQLEYYYLDLRFNILNEYIDFFVFVESTTDHQGKPKKLNFDSKKFKKFKPLMLFVIVILFIINLGLVNAGTNQSWSKDKLLNNLDKVEHELLLLNVKAGELQSIERIEMESNKLNFVKIVKIYHITDNKDKVALK